MLIDNKYRSRIERYFIGWNETFHGPFVDEQQPLQEQKTSVIILGRPGATLQILHGIISEKFVKEV